MSTEVPQGWRNDSYRPANWPDWLMDQHVKGGVKVDRALGGPLGGWLVREKGTRGWGLFTEAGRLRAQVKLDHDWYPEQEWIDQNYKPIGTTEEVPVAKSAKPQTEIANDGGWAEEMQVEVEVEATQEEIMSAARSQADNALKIISLERARTRSAHDFNVKIKAAKGEAEASARIVHTGKRIEMKDAKVHFDPVAKTKTAKSKNGHVYWAKPMTPEELELGDPRSDGQQQADAIEGESDIPF